MFLLFFHFDSWKVDISYGNGVFAKWFQTDLQNDRLSKIDYIQFSALSSRKIIPQPK